MIYARRALQRRLDELRGKIDNEAVDAIVARLNEPGKDRVAAMWEVVVLHGLATTGNLENENALPSGRRPDVWFDGAVIRFVADVTSVSDDGLDVQNPHAELGELLNKAKNKLKLPIGGLDMRIHSRDELSSRGRRTFLKLPPRRRLSEFVNEEILPKLREQLAAGARVLTVTIADEDVGIEIVIDPSNSPINSYGFAAYDVPTIKDKNPLYNALKAKADQLRGAEGISGIILGDGDCAALAERQASPRSVSSEAIAKECLRQYLSLDFVLLLTIREARRPFFPPVRPELRTHAMLICRDDSPVTGELEATFRAMLGKFPQPVNMPVNGARRAREAKYEMGHHGGYKMSGQKIRVSSRELVEVLAGLRTFDDKGARNLEFTRSSSHSMSDISAMFLRQVADGRLPEAITVRKTDENDNDDWIEFDFGEPDPAITPFK